MDRVTILPCPNHQVKKLLNRYSQPNTLFDLCQRFDLHDSTDPSPATILVSLKDILGPLISPRAFQCCHIPVQAQHSHTRTGIFWMKMKHQWHVPTWSVEPANRTYRNHIGEPILSDSICLQTRLANDMLASERVLWLFRKARKANRIASNVCT